MKYVLLGYALGQLFAAEMPNREACEGRAVLLREQKAIVSCVEAPRGLGLTTSSSHMVITPQQQCWYSNGFAKCGDQQ